MTDELTQQTGPKTLDELKDDVIVALKTVYDPEIPVNIYDLGLIYDVIINEQYFVDIKMTLTSPGCPIAASFPGIVESAVRSVIGISDAEVELVWEPPWSMDNMSEAAKLQLGFL